MKKREGIIFGAGLLAGGLLTKYAPKLKDHALAGQLEVFQLPVAWTFVPKFRLLWKPTNEQLAEIVEDQLDAVGAVWTFVNHEHVNIVNVHKSDDGNRLHVDYLTGIGVVHHVNEDGEVVAETPVWEESGGSIGTIVLDVTGEDSTDLIMFLSELAHVPDTVEPDFVDTAGGVDLVFGSERRGPGRLLQLIRPDGVSLQQEWQASDPSMGRPAT